MKRRDFFRLSMPLMSTPFFLGASTVRTFDSFDLFSALDCDTIRDRFLVVIQLKGANDGLNTLMRDDMYQCHYNNHRGNIKIGESQRLLINDSSFKGVNNCDSSGLTGAIDYFLHPAMSKVKDLCEDGKANIIQSVGYPNMNRSHFRSTDIWLTGRDGNPAPNVATQNSGWMGQYLERIFHGNYSMEGSFMADPLGIHLKGKVTSLGFHTDTPHLKAVNLALKQNLPNNIISNSPMPNCDVTCDPLSSGFYSLLTEQGLDISHFLNPTNTCSTREQDIVNLEQAFQRYGGRVSTLFSQGQNSCVDYGNYDLGAQLKTIARLVNGGSKTKIFLTELSGFDTHANQVENGATESGQHALLLEELSESVNNFMAALECMGMLDRCLVVTFSEFGRKVVSNSSFGTDHGTLAPMFVFGHEDNVKAGISGPMLNLHPNFLDAQGAPLVNGGADPNHVDYREVFSTILRQWLGADDNAVDTAFSNYDKTDPNISTATVDLIETDANPKGAAPLCSPFPPLNGEDIISATNEVSIAINVVGNPAVEGEAALLEVVACDYVDLKPNPDGTIGFHAPCGTNVIIYPAECDCPPGGASMAVFKPGILDTKPMDNEVLYTKTREKKGQTELIENRNRQTNIKLKLFPNPTSEYINISFNVREGERKIKLDVYDSQGKIVPVEIPAISTSIDRYEVRINVANLVSGKYFLKYQSEKLTKAFKFVKI